jgi:hypothetical protein
MSEQALLRLAAGAIVLAAFTWWSVHERGIEHKKDVATDNAALAVRHTEVVAQTTANIAKADTADLGADHDQKLIDDYVKSHPTGDVRMCHPAGDSVQRVPANQAADRSAQGTGAGSGAVSEVPAGTPGPNIGPGLDELMLAASRLAVIDRDRQRRQ